MERNLKVKESRIGLGVFALKNYKPGQVIVEVTGNIIHWKELLKIGGIILDNAYRYDDEHYLSPDGVGNYFNHSCDPNAGVVKKGDKLFLKCIRAISANSEITFDYSTITGGDDIWTMKCKCGSRVCRKVAKSFGKLRPHRQRYYVSNKIVPDYILNS